MKITQLTGALLDYWTGRAEGIPADQLRIQLVPRTDNLICVRAGAQRYDPSTNPAVSWPIIDRLGMRLGPYCGGWEATYCGRLQIGATGLEAAMRVYVASVFGPEVPDDATACARCAGMGIILAQEHGAQTVTCDCAAAAGVQL